MSPDQIADGIRLVDLMHAGRPHVIGTAVLQLDAGVAIVDPGPTATLPTLRRALAVAGLSPADIRAVLLTHIHLDHAGASGALVAENPAIEVVVHEIGAPHLVAPQRLMASAAMIFGDQMDRLWGSMTPVPTPNLRVVSGGEALDLDGRRLDVAYTPGHASHHVSFLDRSTGTAFVGDAAGGRILDGPIVVPATPPPDIEIDTIRTSLDRIGTWRPERLFVTHFGPATAVDEHRAQLQDRLDRWATNVRQSLDGTGSDAARASSFAKHVARTLRDTLDEETATAYERGLPPGMSWHGLARYWRKRARR